MQAQCPGSETDLPDPDCQGHSTVKVEGKSSTAPGESQHKAGQQMAKNRTLQLSSSSTETLQSKKPPTLNPTRFCFGSRPTTPRLPQAPDDRCDRLG